MHALSRDGTAPDEMVFKNSAGKELVWVPGWYVPLPGKKINK